LAAFAMTAGGEGASVGAVSADDAAIIVLKPSAGAAARVSRAAASA
jgi:hypothetical protein